MYILSFYPYEHRKIGNIKVLLIFTLVASLKPRSIASWGKIKGQGGSPLRCQSNSKDDKSRNRQSNDTA